jgi:hypothetical protein
MDSELSRILADCIADMERGAGVGDCLKRNPASAAELRPHLEAWAAMGSLPLVQPPAAAFDRGRAAMLGVLKPAPMGFGPLSRMRLAPAWATVPAAAAAVLILLGGAAGTSAALGGPDPAGQVLSVVGVGRDDGGAGGDSNSAVSSCPSPTPEATPQGAEGTEADGEFCDENRGHGNDPDHDDEDNPGQGQGDHGADDPAGTAGEGEDANRGHGNDADNDDPDNPGQGQGNHGTGNNGNGQENPGGNGNAGDPPANGTGSTPADNGNPENPPQGNGNGQDKPKD